MSDTLHDIEISSSIIFEIQQEGIISLKKFIISLKSADENQTLYNFCQHFMNNNLFCLYILQNALETLKDTHISRINKKELSLKLLFKLLHAKQAEIFDAYEKFSGHLEPDLINLLNDETESKSQAIEHFKTKVSEFERQILVNNCVEFDNTRRMRRFDSLAKLLNLKSSLSVCSAIAIHEKQLLIAGNVSLGASPTEIKNCFNERIALIRQYFKVLLSMNPPVKILSASSEVNYEKIKNSDFCKAESLETIQRFITPEYLNFFHQFFRALKSNGGIFQKDIIIFQAFTKLYLSLSSKDEAGLIEGDSDDLTPNDCDTFLNGELVVLLPSNEKSEDIFELAVFHNDSTDLIPFMLSPSNQKIHHFHAEQLIAYYILQNSSEVYGFPPNKIHIGISKPTCIDCETALGKHALFATRGSSKAAFKDTANILSESLERSSSTAGEYEDEISSSMTPKKRPRIMKAQRETLFESPFYLKNPQKPIQVTHFQSSPFLSPGFTKSIGGASEIIQGIGNLLDDMHESFGGPK